MKVQLTWTKICALFVGIAILLVGSLVNNSVYYTIFTIVYWIIGMSFSCKKINERFSIFAYNIGFFVFLISGYTISLIKHGDFSYFSSTYFSSSLEANTHACRTLFISIYFINITYMLLKQGKEEKRNQQSFAVPGLIQQLLEVIIFISFICKLAEGLEQIILVNTVTYYESGRYLSALPSAVLHVSSLFYISSFLYWATFPNKRKTMISIGVVLLNAIIVLMYGERGEPISIIFAVILYVGIRNRAGLKDIIIKRKYIIVTIVLLPIMMFGLQMISYSRNNASYEASISQGVEDFFESQGGTVRIIANSYDLHDKIESMGGHTFVIGEIRYYLKNNIVARLLTGKTRTLRTVEDAFSGDNFLRTYGYAYAPVTYNRFVGAGSTYIAEVFHDGGYIFLILVNILYAVLLSKIDSLEARSFIVLGIYINIFRYIPLLPRGMALDWLTNTFAVQNLLLYFILYVISKSKNR